MRQRQRVFRGASPQRLQPVTNQSHGVRAQREAQLPIVRHHVLTRRGCPQQRRGLIDAHFIEQRQAFFHACHFPGGAVPVACQPFQRSGCLQCGEFPAHQLRTFCQFLHAGERPACLPRRSHALCCGLA